MVICTGHPPKQKKSDILDSRACFFFSGLELSGEFELYLRSKKSSSNNKRLDRLAGLVCKTITVPWDIKKWVCVSMTDFPLEYQIKQPDPTTIRTSILHKIADYKSHVSVVKKKMKSTPDEDFCKILWFTRKRDRVTTRSIQQKGANILDSPDRLFYVLEFNEEHHY